MALVEKFVLLVFIIQVIESISPATGKVIAKVRTSTLQEASNAITEARKAWPQWALLPAPTRGEIIRQIGEELRNNLKPLGRLVSLEMGISCPATKFYSSICLFNFNA